MGPPRAVLGKRAERPGSAGAAGGRAGGEAAPAPPERRALPAPSLRPPCSLPSDHVDIFTRPEVLVMLCCSVTVSDTFFL